MQRNDKKTIDTRTFPEIWAELTDGEQSLLKDKLIDECRTTAKSVWAWRSGKQVPMFPNQRTIATVLARMGYKTTTRTLFPKEN